MSCSIQNSLSFANESTWMIVPCGGPAGRRLELTVADLAGSNISVPRGCTIRYETSVKSTSLSSLALEVEQRGIEALDRAVVEDIDPRRRGRRGTVLRVGRECRKRRERGECGKNY